MAALWGGRFTQESDPRFKAFNDSLSFDYRLAVQDVDGSQAWAEGLGAAGVLSAAEGASLKTALAELRAEVSAAPAKGAASHTALRRVRVFSPVNTVSAGSRPKPGSVPIFSTPVGSCSVRPSI